MLDHEQFYTFPLLVAKCCNHEQKTNYLSLKETLKKKYYHHKSFLRLFHEDILFYYYFVFYETSLLEGNIQIETQSVILQGLSFFQRLSI